MARCIAIAVFALAPAACMRDLPVPELVKQAKEQQAKGDWPSSIVNLKNALLKQPENAEARYLLGVAYNETGDALSAEKELRFARKLGLIEGGHVDAELGRALVAAGKFQETLDEIKPLPGFDARAVAGVHAARGHANLGLGKPAEAAKAFEEALASQPDYPYAQIGQAQLALMQGKRDAGIALLDQILKKSPRYFDENFHGMKPCRSLMRPSTPICTFSPGAR